MPDVIHDAISEFAADVIGAAAILQLVIESTRDRDASIALSYVEENLRSGVAKFIAITIEPIGAEK